MNSLKNKVQLIGNLGMYPEIINLDKGKRLAKFSMASHETYYNLSGEKVTDIQWHNLVAWDSVASRVEKVLKKRHRSCNRR